MAASTPRQIMLRKAGEALSPDKSVANLNALAQVLLANVAIVGTVLTVLGAFTDSGDQFVVEVKITVGPAENATLLASRRVIAGSSGEVDLTFDTSTGKELKSATLIVLVTKDGEQLFSRKVTRE